MNPELKRNIIIEITLQRLIAMPVILGLIFTAMWASATTDKVILWSELFFWVFVFLWGVRKAAGSFDGELANNTWDGQRLSALTAGQIFFGKLFGSTSFVLYGTLITLLISTSARFELYSQWHDRVGVVTLPSDVLTSGEIVLSAANDMLSALLGLVVAMFIAVVLMTRTRSSKGISVTVCQVFAIAVAGLFGDRLGHFSPSDISHAVINNQPVPLSTVDWFGNTIPLAGFVTASLIVALLWAVLGTIRQLRSVLQFRGYRWAWALFVLFAGVYLAGFDVLYRNAAVFDERAFVFLTVIWIAAAMSTYLAVFTEAKPMQGYRSYVAAVRRGRVLDVLEHQPFWLTSLILVLVALVLNLAFAGPQTVIGNGIAWEMAITFRIGHVDAEVKKLLVVATLFLVRDCALVMALNFGRRRRRADLAALIYLTVLYVLVPVLLAAFDLERSVLMRFFVPQVFDGLIASAWPVVLEVAGLAALMIFRWRTVRQPVAVGGD